MGNRAFCNLGFALPFTIAGFMGLTGNNSVFAQLTQDNTLGAESSTVTVEELRDLIRGGAIRGNALFHSFSEFNVGSDRGVFFDLQNNADILNIFTRVTGSNSSSILGTLGVLNDLGSANLFLLNPNGITFGANASLDLNGSFFATTADSFDFENFSFSASGQEAPPPLLTVSIPRFLSFRDNPGTIVNQSAITAEINNNTQTVGLRVQPDQTIGLVGGEIQFTGGYARAQDGRLEVGAVGSNSVVSFTETETSESITGYVFGYEGVETFGDIILEGGDISTNGLEGGGIVQLRANNIRLSNGSNVSSNTAGDRSPGNVTISSSQLIIEEESRIQASPFGSQLGASIKIDTNELTIQSGGRIITSVGKEAAADGGEITINATESVDINSRDLNYEASGIFAQALENSTGNAGNVSIETNRFLAQDGGEINANTLGAGDGGSITINATESVELIGERIGTQAPIPSLLFSQARQGSTGNAGNVTIDTRQFLAQNGGGVNINTFAPGNAGNITINATESVELIGERSDGNSLSLLFTQAVKRENTTTIVGNAGNVTINTSQLLLQGGGQISVRSFGEGKSGDITINATESVELIGRSPVGIFPSAFFAQAGGESAGGGNINVETSRLLIQDGAIITSDTRGAENGGNITINATESVELIGRSPVIRPGSDNPLLDLKGSRISTDVFVETATGNGGNITIDTPQLLIQDGAFIRASTVGVGNSGNIKVEASDTVLVEGNLSGIFSFAGEGATGNAGSINIDPQQVTVRDGGIISVSSSGIGEAGVLTIISDNLTLDNGRIIATTASADGGNIELDIADLLLLRNGNSIPLISATAEGEGNGGNLNIDTTFLVAFPNENSDITANANLGDGGDVNITATSIYGIEFQETATNLSDITASSDFGLSGTVILNTPETQTNQEQIEQPEEVVDSSDIVSQSVCSDFGGDSQLANSGRGGVPQIPGFIIRNDVVDVELVDEVLLPPPPPEAIKPHHRTDVTFLDSEGEEFKPAMGAVLLPNGMVEFVDYNPAEVYRDMYAAAGCNRLSKE